MIFLFKKMVDFSAGFPADFQKFKNGKIFYNKGACTVDLGDISITLEDGLYDVKYLKGKTWFKIYR